MGRGECGGGVMLERVRSRGQRAVESWARWGRGRKVTGCRLTWRSETSGEGCAGLRRRTGFYAAV